MQLTWASDPRSGRFHQYHTGYSDDTNVQCVIECLSDMGTWTVSVWYEHPTNALDWEFNVTGYEAPADAVEAVKVYANRVASMLHALHTEDASDFAQNV